MRREERNSRDRGRRRHRNNRGGRGKKPGERELHTQQKREWPKSDRRKKEWQWNGHRGWRRGISQSQSRHKKGHMVNIYWTDSDEEAIVFFVKDHGELYDSPTSTLRTIPGRNACGRGIPAASSCLSKCARIGLNPKELATEKSPTPSLARLPRKWQRGRAGFRINLTSWRHTSDTRDSANTSIQPSSPHPDELVHLLPQHTSPDMDSMEINMQSNTTIQPSVTSPSAVSQRSAVDQQVMGQFTEMKNMLSSFLRPRQETSRTAFCNYLASEFGLRL